MVDEMVQPVPPKSEKKPQDHIRNIDPKQHQAKKYYGVDLEMDSHQCHDSYKDADS
jgi:hypothetical protein